MTTETWQIIAPIIYTAAVCIPLTAIVCYLAWVVGRHPMDELPENVANLVGTILITTEIKEVIDASAESGYVADPRARAAQLRKISEDLESVLEPLGICFRDLPRLRRAEAREAALELMIKRPEEIPCNLDGHVETFQNRSDVNCKVCAGTGIIYDDFHGVSYVCSCTGENQNREEVQT